MAISPLKQIKSLGSAQHGSGPWWSQRVTAMALVPLGLWFLSTLWCHDLGTYEGLKIWIQAPHRSIFISLLLGTLFYHGYLGMAVVIEDYIHVRWIRVGLRLLTQFTCIAATTAGIFSVLKLALSS